MPRQRANVDIKFNRVRDDVELGTAVNHRGRKGRVRACVELTGHAEREKFEDIVESIFCQQRSGNFFWIAHRFDEAPPDLMNVRFRLKLADTPNDLRSGEQCVVGLVGLRAMASGSPHSDSDPEEALFTHDDRQFQPVGAGEWDTTRFSDDVVGHDCITLVIDEVLGAVYAI